MLSVEPVVARTIARHFTWGCRVGEQRAGRRLHRRKAHSRIAEAARERVVAAGVEDHDIDPRSCALHHRQHAGGVHRLIFDFIFAAYIGTYRNQKIPIVDLHPVTGEIKQPDAAPGMQFVAEFAHRLTHLAL